MNWLWLFIALVYGLMAVGFLVVAFQADKTALPSEVKANVRG